MGAFRTAHEVSVDQSGMTKRTGRVTRLQLVTSFCSPRFSIRARTLEKNLFATNSHLLWLLSFCWLAIKLTWQKGGGPSQNVHLHISALTGLLSSHARVCFCKFPTALVALTVCKGRRFLRLSPFPFCLFFIRLIRFIYANILMSKSRLFCFSNVYDLCSGGDLFRFLFCRCLIVGPHTYWQGEQMKNPCKTSKHWDLKHLHWTSTNSK